MDDLAAQDAVLAVPGLQVAIGPERTRRNLMRKSPAKIRAVPAEAGIEDGDLDAATPVPGGMPAVDAQSGQVLQSKLKGINRGWTDFGFRCRTLACALRGTQPWIASEEGQGQGQAKNDGQQTRESQVPRVPVHRL